MAWVTLSLRKMELVHQHNDLEMEDLRLSREKRQMARQYQLEETKVQNEFNQMIAEAKADYKTEKQGITNDKDAYSTTTDYQAALSEASQNYQEVYNEYKTQCENEVSMIEEEANDKESEIEDRKTQIETQMEAVAAEMDAIKQQISTDIQNEAIQLH